MFIYINCTNLTHRNLFSIIFQLCRKMNSTHSFTPDLSTLSVHRGRLCTGGQSNCFRGRCCSRPPIGPNTDLIASALLMCFWFWAQLWTRRSLRAEMTDWWSRAPSVNMIYFVHLEIVAAFFFFSSMKFITNIDPSSLSPLLHHPLSFSFLDLFDILSRFYCRVHSVSEFRVLFDLWRTMSSLTDWSFSLDLCAGPAAQGSPLLAALPVQTRPLQTPLELKNFLPFRLNGSNPLSLFPNFNTVSQTFNFGEIGVPVDFFFFKCIWNLRAYS